MIKVFYDGKCGLCSKEINYYKKIAPKGIFDWIDITENPQTLEKYNIRLEYALKKLHLLDNKGNMLVGIDSFIVIWKQMRYFKILGYLVSLPIIKQITQYAYNKFADWRFNRLEHCQLAMNKKI